MNMTKALISFALGMVVSTTANAGITIHFKGNLSSESAGVQMEEAACGQAKKNLWRCESIAGQSIATQDGITARILSELDGSNALSKARGVVIYMHDMSEPLYLVYGSSLRIKNFVKTQFAGADVHIKAVELLQSLKPYFESLEVEDEGGYWLTQNRRQLETELEGVEVGITNIRRLHPDAQGPIKRPDGRILDLVSKK